MYIRRGGSGGVNDIAVQAVRVIDWGRCCGGDGPERSLMFRF